MSLGGRTYDPDDPMGKMFFNILATFAEFEVDLIRMRTREGMAVARAQGKLKGRQPKLSPKQQRELKRMHEPASTRSPTSASCSRCHARRSTARSTAPPPSRPSDPDRRSGRRSTWRPSG